LSTNTVWGMLAEGGRVITSGVCFFLLARALGAQQFGHFAGLLALISVFFPFSSLGAGNLMVMRVARDPSQFPREWYAALRTGIIGGSVSVVLATLAAKFVMPAAPVTVVLAIAVAELLACSALEIAGHAYVAHDRLRGLAFVRTLLGVSRVLGLLILLVSGSPRTLTTWAPTYLLATVVAAVGAVVAAIASFGGPERSPFALRELGRGLPFAFGAASAEVQDDIDKTLLVRFGLLTEAGIYAVAYRVVSFVFLPVRALLFASYATFFRAGEAGVQSAQRLARRLMRVPLIYTSAMAVLGLGTAGIFERMLGDGYESVGLILRLLLFLPVVRVLQYFAADALTGSGYQRSRAALQSATALLNIVLNLLLIPGLGWRGPVIATFTSEVLFAAALWWRLAHLSQKERTAPRLISSREPSGVAA
jgi:O-antigen/teichoic acid export membrane protein